MPLLGPNDVPPFRVRNPNGRSTILFISDHNGVEVPEALGGLGVPAGRDAPACRVRHRDHRGRRHPGRPV